MRTDTLIIHNGNPFPSFEGEALSWSIGLYDTLNEHKAGYPRLRTVVRAMAEHRPQQLADECKMLRRASFDRMFGNAARHQLSIIESELQ